MALILPKTNSEAYSTNSVTMGGVEYTLTFRWVERCKGNEYWLMDMTTAEGDVALGVKLVPGISLIRNRPFFDHGAIILLKTSSTTYPPGRYNIGSDKDYRLLYVTNKEIAELLADEEI